MNATMPMVWKLPVLLKIFNKQEFVSMFENANHHIAAIYISLDPSVYVLYFIGRQHWIYENMLSFIRFIQIENETWEAYRGLQFARQANQKCHLVPFFQIGPTRSRHWTGRRLHKYFCEARAWFVSENIKILCHWNGPETEGRIYKLLLNCIHWVGWLKQISCTTDVYKRRQIIN